MSAEANPLDDFVIETPRPLPLIALLDTSSSMAGQKIQTLNVALREMRHDLANGTTPQGEIHIGAIEFNQSVNVENPVRARDYQPRELQAGGCTMMGQAIDRACSMIEDRSVFQPRSYAPTLVLISDGAPTDSVDAPITRLLNSPRGKKATRLALAIGDDANVDTLKQFIADPEIPVLRANDVAKIRDFFRWVTMSMLARSRSRNPDMPTLAPITDFGEDDIAF